MNFKNLIVGQSALAFKIIQSYFNNPSIAGVTIYQERLTRTYPTGISKQVIIDNTGGRKVIHDNFALEPKGWKLQGYIKAIDYEFSTYFMPSLKQQIQQLEAARDTGDTVEFKDKYGKIYNVGIEKMDIDETAECQNAIPIEFDLVDVTVINATTALTDNITGGALPKDGSQAGNEAQQVTGQAGKVKSINVQIFGGGND